MDLPERSISRSNKSALENFDVVSKNFISENGYAYKFDLKKGYHHVEDFKEHQTFLRLSWRSRKLKRYFIFTVLPFGLSSEPMIFTKLLRPLLSYWYIYTV